MPKSLSWEQALVDGDEPLEIAQRVFRHLPHDPRCRMCRSPFAGVGGRMFRWVGRTPSRKNPNLCTPCFDLLPDGGIEVAFVGKVGQGSVIDFTALGYAVNTASRLQSYAKDDEVVLAAELYDLVDVVVLTP